MFTVKCSFSLPRFTISGKICAFFYAYVSKTTKIMFLLRNFFFSISKCKYLNYFRLLGKFLLGCSVRKSYSKAGVIFSFATKLSVMSVLFFKFSIIEFNLSSYYS